MPFEIERKFLIKDVDFLKSLKNGCPIVQGYISLDKDRVVRVRTKGEKAFVTFKSKLTAVSRREYEYEIPFKDAVEMLDHMCLKPLIQKTRYSVLENGFTFEIDVFEDVFKGIIIAEVELDNEETSIPLPYWIGAEVTHDPQYYNAEMVKQNLLFY